MNRSEFEIKLQRVYTGKVTAVNSYVNERCSMLFHCSKCDTDFWGKAGHIVGENRHICTMPYADIHGERLAKVIVRQKARKKAPLNVKQFNSMIQEGYTYKEIASKLKVNPVIIEDYFEKEGLI